MNTTNTFVQFLTNINPWWEDSKYKYSEIINRPNYTNQLLDTNNRLIKVLIGARRVGKTSILQECVNLLLKNNSPKHIIYLPADLPDIQNQGIKTSLELLSSNLKINIFKDDIHVFIDEVQELEGWQKEIKLLYDNTKINFYLTGSSSLILKNETSKLTGRFILIHVLPLDFNEFKKFYKRKTKSEEELLEIYIQKGGYPEYVINQSPVYLQQAVESTLYRELLTYYGIRNPRLLIDILKFLADKVTTTVSARNLADNLKIDDKTVKFYLDYLESVYIIYPVYRYGMSHKISKSSVPKYYFADNGILSLYGIRSRIGHLTENLVFLKLLQKERLSEIHEIYYDLINSQEVDFKLNGELFEVKSYANLDPEYFDKLVRLDKEITIIGDFNKANINDLPHHSNLKYLSLLEFIKQDRI